MISHKEISTHQYHIKYKQYTHDANAITCYAMRYNVYEMQHMLHP